MDHSSKLLAAATSTFEQLGFLFADYELEDFQAKAPLDAAARVVFTGPMHGAIDVRVTKALLPRLTQNMLGEEDTQDEADWADALGEVTNVICGNVLPQIAGPEAVFDLERPQVALSGNGLAPYPGLEITSGVLGIEDGRAQITPFLDSGP